MPFSSRPYRPFWPMFESAAISATTTSARWSHAMRQSLFVTRRSYYATTAASNENFLVSHVSPLAEGPETRSDTPMSVMAAQRLFGGRAGEDLPLFLPEGETVYGSAVTLDGAVSGAVAWGGIMVESRLALERVYRAWVLWRAIWNGVPVLFDRRPDGSIVTIDPVEEFVALWTVPGSPVLRPTRMEGVGEMRRQFVIRAAANLGDPSSDNAIPSAGGYDVDTLGLVFAIAAASENDAQTETDVRVTMRIDDISLMNRGSTVEPKLPANLVFSTPLREPTPLSFPIMVSGVSSIVITADRLAGDASAARPQFVFAYIPGEPESAIPRLADWRRAVNGTAGPLTMARLNSYLVAPASLVGGT